MAIIKRGILGGFSKKIGSVVGSSWKGIAVMKSLPLSVANPNTVKQQGVRKPFAACVSLASILLGIFIKRVWNRGAMQMSGFNAFVQANVKTAFQASGALTLNELNISPSSESPATIELADCQTGHETATIHWDADIVGNQQNSDLAVCLILDQNGVYLGCSAFSVQRSDGMAVVALKRALLIGEPLGIYLMFQSADGFRNFGQFYFGQNVI